MFFLKKIFNDTLHLLYPHLCAGCGKDLPYRHDLLCLRCIQELPHTGFAAMPGNPVEKYFWGRLPIAAAHSEFYFTTDSLIQQLLHQLKYKGNERIGRFLGELLGKSLLNSGRFHTIDALIPLPLHPDRERRRGYNQAAIIGMGVAEALHVPLLTDIVMRQTVTETQTRKHRAERWDNVSNSFTVSDKQALAGKHLLLIDDVVTTGATLEACGRVILEINDVKLSMATVAHTSK